MGEGLESVKVSWDGGLIRVLPLCALEVGGGPQGLRRSLAGASVLCTQSGGGLSSLGSPIS